MRARWCVAAALVAFPVAAGERLAGAARVIDGDTIVIAGTRVRLAGLNAPELDTAAGLQSKAALERLISGRPVVCDVRAWQKAKGSYPPRAIGDCSANGLDLDRAMVGEGFARR